MCCNYKGVQNEVGGKTKISIFEKSSSFIINYLFDLGELT